MKYNYYLGVFIILLLIISTYNHELKLDKKPSKTSKRNSSKAKKIGKSSPKSKKPLKIKSYPSKIKEKQAPINNLVDLDVLIRFRFSKYGSNVLANFVSGILSAFYGNQFPVLSKQEDSGKIVNNHIDCIHKQLNSIFENEQTVTAFENKFIFGGLYPLDNHIKDYFIFTHQYKVLERKNYIIRIIRRLKEITGTFESLKKKKISTKKRKLSIKLKTKLSNKNSNSISKKNKLNKINKKTNSNLFKDKTSKRKKKVISKKKKTSKSKNKKTKKNIKNRKNNAKTAMKMKINNGKTKIIRGKKSSKKTKTRKIDENFINFKVGQLKKQIEEKRKLLKTNRKLNRIIGKHYKGISQYAKFMTYGFRKVWFYSSFYTQKVLSCSLTAASFNPTIQKSFLALKRMNQRLACPFNYIDILTMMFSDHIVRNSFDILFYQLFHQGVKNRLIHKIKWSKIGQAVFNSHQVLAKLCPWFYS